MPDQVRVGVGAFILSSSSSSSSSTQNPTFLIGKRLGSHGAGTYALPGGHLEFGESPEECAAREILEETGLQVKNVRFLTATNDFLREEKKHYVTMFVVCERDFSAPILIQYLATVLERAPVRTNQHIKLLAVIFPDDCSQGRAFGQIRVITDWAQHFTTISEMSSSDVAVKSMDLARSITDILGKGGAVSGLVGETMKWLAREKIDEADFTHCLNKTRALLYPNSKGLEIQSSLRKSDETLRRNPFVAGLRLLGAGNIGRWMAQSPEYCYLATTVATLLMHHDMRYAADAICHMVLLKEGQVDKGIGAHNLALSKSRLLPVLEKVVDSITLNVVNCGHDLGSLPPQLRDICSHTCDAQTFATVTMALAKSSDNLTIRCKKFVVDVFVWTLAHIEGKIELSVVGEIVYKEDIGSSKRSLLFLVDEDCSCDQQQRSMADEHVDCAVTVSTSIEGDLRTFLRQDGHLKNMCGTNPYTRAVLYDVDDSTGCSLGALLPSEKHEILQVSQKIILWILQRPAYLCTIGHSNAPVVPSASNTLIGDLLSRWPRICNEYFDIPRIPATVDRLAGDAAGLSESLSIERNTSRILISLLGNHVVSWEWWFGLAASVCLGCPIAELNGLRITKCQAVAVQYGSFVVAAPWIDLHNNIQVVGSFGFECAQARICGIDADWAIIRTESTSRSSSLGTLDLSEVKLPQHNYHEVDVVGVSLQSTIQSAHVPISRNINATYVLVTLAKIGRIWTFEEAMGLWEADDSGAGSSIWTSYTTVLDSHAKYNTLLILSPQGCIVKTADCCFACAQKELDTRFRDSKARRVLSIAIDEERLIRR
ncbi:hypothetical protein MBLNU13_g01887t1 [Cladosporium sp. NU13]